MITGGREGNLPPAFFVAAPAAGSTLGARRLRPAEAPGGRFPL